MKDQQDERTIHRATMLAAAEAAVGATAQILQETEEAFISAFAHFKQATKAHTHAVITLEHVKIDQQDGNQGDSPIADHQIAVSMALANSLKPQSKSLTEVEQALLAALEAFIRERVQ